MIDYFILHKRYFLKHKIIYVSLNIGPWRKLFFSVMNITEKCTVMHKEFFSNICTEFYQC
jgi:hypothetical protein